MYPFSNSKWKYSILFNMLFLLRAGTIVIIVSLATLSVRDQRVKRCTL